MVKQVELIRRCQQGDREAMGRLYTAMHDELLSVCRHYVADRSVAEDLLHDAFLLIFSKIGELRSPRKAQGWMRKVVKNVALLYVEKQHEMPTVPLDQVGDLPPLTSYASPLSVTYDELMHIVDALPEGYRRVFRLSVLEGLSHQEIAALLNIEPHSSSSQLYRAKSMLRQSLAMLLLSLVAVVVYRFVTNKYAESDKQAVAESCNQGIVNNSNHKHVKQQPTVGTRTTVKTGSDQVKHQPTVGTDSCICPQAETSGGNHTQDGGGQMEETQEAGGQIQEHVPTIDGGGSPIMAASRYHLSLAYSGLPNHNTQSLPIGIEGTNGPIDSTAHHRMPLTAALDVSRQLNSRWSLNGGLRFTLLSSEFQVGNTLLHIDRSQHVRYLGLSLGTTYRLWPAIGGDATQRNSLRRSTWKLRPLSIYSSASLNCDLPLRSTVETTYLKGDKAVSTESTRLHPSTQWSLGAGLGAQYSVTPAVAFFVEPSLHYYIPTHDGIDTWCTEHPLTFSLPLGVRITF